MVKVFGGGDGSRRPATVRALVWKQVSLLSISGLTIATAGAWVAIFELERAGCGAEITFLQHS
jgi:hypothetical protein